MQKKQRLMQWYKKKLVNIVGCVKRKDQGEVIVIVKITFLFRAIVF